MYEPTINNVTGVSYPWYAGANFCEYIWEWYYDKKYGKDGGYTPMEEAISSYHWWLDSMPYICKMEWYE